MYQDNWAPVLGERLQCSHEVSSKSAPMGNGNGEFFLNYLNRVNFNN